MIEDDLRKLIARDAGLELTGVEASLWQREGRERAANQAGRALASWQAAVIAIAIIGSAGAGILAASRTSPTPQYLATGVDLAPSTLIFGKES